MAAANRGERSDMPDRASNPLELKFRGERRYLHGTDLFNALFRIAR